MTFHCHLYINGERWKIYKVDSWKNEIRIPLMLPFDSSEEKDPIAETLSMYFTYWKRKSKRVVEYRLSKIAQI